MNELINFEKTADVEQEILELMQDIPFENSHAQTREVMAACLVPERAFKMLGLRLMTRLNDLKVCGIKRKQVENEIEILEFKISKLHSFYNQVFHTRLSELTERGIQLEIDEKKAWFDHQNKLAGDCKAELSYLYNLIKKMPKYTREEFERGDERWVKIQSNYATMHGKGQLKTDDLLDRIEAGEVDSVRPETEKDKNTKRGSLLSRTEFNAESKTSSSEKFTPLSLATLNITVND